jgi:hypothetical protein
VRRRLRDSNALLEAFGWIDLPARGLVGSDSVLVSNRQSEQCGHWHIARLRRLKQETNQTCLHRFPF